MGSSATEVRSGAQSKLRDRVRLERVRAARRVYPCSELAESPSGFAREVLGFEPWVQQETWMDAVARPDASVSVVSGHKTGKSVGAASTALWFWGTRRRARVVLMAPKIEHVKKVIWPEVQRLYRLGGYCPSCRARAAETPEAISPCSACSPLGDPSWIGDDAGIGLRSPDGREIFAYASRKIDAVGGLSGPEMLFIFDEASGIDEGVFEAMRGNSAGGARWVLIGNGIRTVGEFYESHHQKKRFYTFTLSIPSTDTPNAIQGDRAIPGLATREWCEQRAEEWGKDSQLYAVRVLGQFPRYEEGQLISIDALEAAEKRWHEREDKPAAGRLVLGVDVGFTGDDAAIAARRGTRILELLSLRGIDEESLAANVASCARAHRGEREAKPVVQYDSNGPGARLGKSLRQYSEELDAVPVNGTNKPRKPREFFQLRDEMAASFAAWVKLDGELPEDLKLEGEILATRATDGGGGRARVLSNEWIKKLIGRSPDRRNACELATWNTLAAAVDDDLHDLGSHVAAVAMDPYAGAFVGGAPGIDPYAGVM